MANNTYVNATIGRATTALATQTNCTNLGKVPIATGIPNPLDINSCISAVYSRLTGANTTIHFTILDTPGTAGTYYYSLWIHNTDTGAKQYYYEMFILQVQA